MQRIKKFVSQYATKTYKRGEIIFMQGGTPCNLFAIKSGFVKGYDIDGKGCEQLVWLGSKWDLFPIVWAFSIVPTVPYFFSAFSDVELYVIDRQAFLDFLQKNQVALLEVTHKLATRLEDALRHINATEKTKAEDKIIHTLYFLSLRFGYLGQVDSRQITLPVTHQDIANLLGLTRETVTLELKKLKDNGYINYDKSYFLIHQNKLEQIL